MGIGLTTIGGILVLLCTAGGSRIRSNLLTTDGFVPQGDRIFAGLIGIALIAAGLAHQLDAPRVCAISSFGVAAGFTVLYAAFLAWTARR